jgi:tetratricopeptide (TPR) repeat protein
MGSMKKSNWLDLTEYCLLAGSGVGAVAAIVSQQLAFTATPVSLLLIVNLINRRRFDDAIETRSQESITFVEHRLSKQIETIDRRVQGLPTFWDLASLRKTVLQKNRLATSQVHQELSHRLAELEKQESPLLMQTQITHLREQQAKMQAALQTAEKNLHRIVSHDRMRDTEDQLQEMQLQLHKVEDAITKFSRTLNPNALKTIQGHIDHLNRRFTALPNPVDTERLQQEMKEVLKSIKDMASRRELERAFEEIVQVRTQQERLDVNVRPIYLMTKLMRRQVLSLEGEMRKNNLMYTNNLGTADAGEIGQLKAAIDSMEQRLQHAPAEVDLVQLRGELFSMLESQSEKLTQDIQGVQQSHHNLTQQQQMMEGWIKRLPEFLDFSSLRNQMKYLGDRLDGHEHRLDQADAQLGTLQSVGKNAKYELLFDLPNTAGANHNRTLLEAALETATESVTMVLPHPDRSIFDKEWLKQVRAFLDRGGKLDLGWGYLSNLEQPVAPRYIQARSSVLQADKGFLKKILTQLNELRRCYPDQFRFKVLGTDDSFLVCDRDYAILGSQVNLQSQAFPRLAVGLRTNNTEVIERLVERFEQPVLNDEDDLAYFKRALTRSDLDEPEGAIADYTRVIQINPKHDVAYNNRGLMRYEMGNREGAIADFNRAILVNSGNSIAYCNRGVVRSEMGNLMGAVEDFSDAVQVSPSCAPAFFQRGLARTQMGNKMGAVEDFSEVIRLDDQDASAFYYRGLARTKLGDRIGAIRDLKESAKLFLLQENSAGHQQAMGSINQLQKSLVIEGSAEGGVAARRS